MSSPPPLFPANDTLQQSRESRQPNKFCLFAFSSSVSPVMISSFSRFLFSFECTESPRHSWSSDRPAHDGLSPFLFECPDLSTFPPAATAGRSLFSGWVFVLNALSHHRAGLAFWHYGLSFFPMHPLNRAWLHVVLSGTSFGVSCLFPLVLFWNQAPPPEAEGVSVAMDGASSFLPRWSRWCTFPWLTTFPLTVTD